MQIIAVNQSGVEEYWNNSRYAVEPVPHVGAGYQSVFKIHGNHLDTSSLHRESGIFGSKILSKSGLDSHPSKMGEKETA